MRNRAKCKLCGSLIESFHSEDVVYCKCEEICVFGGDAMRCSAADFANFLRVDDEGREIAVCYQEKQAQKDAHDTPKEPFKPITREDLVDMLDKRIETDDKLPEHVKFSPALNADMIYYMMLISHILKRDKL